NGLQESSFIVSQDSLERVWLNLPPQASIKDVSPSPAIKGELRDPVDGATLAWWPLDEGSGTAVFDVSGNGHDLTLGLTPSWAAGHDGSAVLFDGQYVYLAGPRLSLAMMTIELWFNTTGANGTLLSDREGGDSSWNHHLYFVEGEPRFSHTQGGTPILLAAGAQFNDGAWHHLAVVRSSEQTSLWVDGVLRTSTTFGAPDLSQGDTWLGMLPGGGAAYAGLLDSVRLSTIARHSGDFLIGGGTVVFQGQASDPDGEFVSWSWYSSQDGLLGQGARLEIGIDSLSPGSHSITLQVSDSNGSTSPASTSLVVMQRPGAVILEAPSLVQEGALASLAGEATGGMSINAWEWRSDRDGLLGSAAAIQLSTLSNGTHNLVLRVQASNGLWSENATAQLLVNGRPRLYDLALSALTLNRTGSLTLEAAALDDVDSGEQLLLNASYQLDGTGSWETGYLSPPAWEAGRVVFTFAPDLDASPGSYEFRVGALDSSGGASGWLALPQLVELVNLPPQVSASQTP
ncbi:MAG: LamG domain-containing protein, partial [Candidatus Poseidoniia archaeon]|nr:LamG domain-containing protein [Candidatus Poseidoniia archaeon]